MWINILAVGTGGFIGSVFRYMIGLVPFFSRGSIPFHTLIANVLGALLIGIIMSYSDSYGKLDETAMLFLKVGICGGFTTFSTFSLEALGFLESGKLMLFASYITASILLCLAGVILGKWLVS